MTDPNGVLKFGRLYEHYKRGLYEPLMLVLQEGTGDTMVVYRSVETAAVWTRPLREWHERVDHPSGLYQVSRYQLTNQRSHIDPKQQQLEKLLGNDSLADYLERMRGDVNDLQELLKDGT